MASFYSITITNPNTGAAAPNDGFIDSLRIEDYYDTIGLETTPAGLTFALCETKMRANQRYQMLVQQLGFSCNIYIDPNSISAPAATALTPATSFTFIAWIEWNDQSLVTPDELNPGQYLSGPAALQRFAARGLIIDRIMDVAVFDPTSYTVPGNTNSVPRTGSRIVSIEVGPIATNITAANALVAVTPIVQN